MLYHCIHYTIDRHKLNEFKAYARRWMEGGIITRCGGKPLGYFLPKRGFGGPDNIAIALIGFQNLAAYESYRSRIAVDLDSKKNLADAEKSRCIVVENRSYFYRVSENGVEK